MQYSKIFAACKVLSLKEVMLHFGISYPDHISHIKCPFPEHGATGNTPSFRYYMDTDTFFCWGCKRGGGAVEFTSGMLSISRVEAATRLVKEFNLTLTSSTLEKAILRVEDRMADDKVFCVVQKVVSFIIHDPVMTDRIRFVMELYKSYME